MIRAFADQGSFLDRENDLGTGLTNHLERVVQAMTTATRVALVTGASKGIGRGIALGLAAKGWDVAINYNRDEAGARETASTIAELGRQSWLFQGDVGYSDQVRRMFEAFRREVGRLHLLVNNAGVQTWASLLELQEEDWVSTFRTIIK